MEGLKWNILERLDNDSIWVEQCIISWGLIDGIIWTTWANYYTLLHFDWSFFMFIFILPIPPFKKKKKKRSLYLRFCRLFDSVCLVFLLWREVNNPLCSRSLYLRLYFTCVLSVTADDTLYRCSWCWMKNISQNGEQMLRRGCGSRHTVPPTDMADEDYTPQPCPRSSPPEYWVRTPVPHQRL